MTVERPPTPTEDRIPAWRRACLAFREMRQAGASDQEAHEAAVAAVQTVLPLSWKEASAEAVNERVRLLAMYGVINMSMICWLLGITGAQITALREVPLLASDLAVV